MGLDGDKNDVAIVATKDVGKNNEKSERSNEPITLGVKLGPFDDGLKWAVNIASASNWLVEYRRRLHQLSTTSTHYATRSNAT